jgi:hypothetical protein
MDARNLILVELQGDRRLAKFADTHQYNAMRQAKP